VIRPPDEDGYELWLRYRLLRHPAPLARYREQLRSVVPLAANPTLEAAARELCRGLSGLLGSDIGVGHDPAAPGALLLGQRGAPLLAAFEPPKHPPELGRDGFVLQAAAGESGPRTAILGASELGALYGAFHLLRLIQCGKDIERLSTWSRPRTALRVLDHWDNLDRSVERGYAGFSLWNWHALPHHLEPRYTEYARACASLGINGSVLTNVNANALVLSDPWIEKVAALADIFRPYGVRVYLTARFSAPIELDGLHTADPRDKDVKAWWQRRVDSIYRCIPDFGGFVVKANSEGQPGPQNYGRSHAEGANLIADALAEHGGVMMWRAFVYDHRVSDDRAKQAYSEFVPLDGRFRRNVLLQVKNGPIDFMPREPHHPLFGAMPKTPLSVEFQLTQEYLGQGTHLCYLGTLLEECLQTDTHADGTGSTVAAIVDGSLHGHTLSGMCAVANIGTDRNWCGHPFAAANWYAFGRLAWDHTQSARQIADEWLRQTFSTESAFVEPALGMMLGSRDAVVDYMAPLGLHHQMAEGHHYGPAPWLNDGRTDWTSVYYHRADAAGIGFDRTPTGSNAVEQYVDPIRRSWSNPKKCPEELLLWFHHVPWTEPLRSGRTLWHELCHRYQRGVDAVRQMQATWQRLEPLVDAARFEHTRALLAIQEREARWWRDACVLYFQTFSRLPLPAGYEPPEKTLEEYRTLRHFYVPGIHNPFVPVALGREDPSRASKDEKSQ
jgi:alpha-glucuronidase